MLALTVVGCGKGGGGGEELAVVNNVTIPMVDYFKTMERKNRLTAFVNPQALAADPSSGRLGTQLTVVQPSPSLAFQALQECIANEIIRQVAKDEAVYPKPEDVEAEIKLEEERDPNFVKNLSQEGLSIDQIKSELTLRLARLNLQAKGVTVTDADVDKFVKDNPAQFTVPAKAALQYIEVNDQKTRDLADKELKEGQMFAAVAQHYSTQPNGKEMQYRFPEETIANMAPALQKLVGETKEFTATKWVFDDGRKKWVKFYVQRKTKPQPVNMNNYLRQMVKRELQRTKGARSQDPNKRIAEKLKTSKIEIKVKYLEEPWKKAYAELTKPKDEPKAETTGAAK